MDELGPNNFRRYVQYAKPLVICFLDPEKKELKDQIIAVSVSPLYYSVVHLCSLAALQ